MPSRCCASVKKTLKSALKSPPNEDAQGNVHPIRRRYACSFASGAREMAMSGTDEATFTRESPPLSAFTLEDGVVYHTYSTYARGLDGLWGMYQWLDRAPKGRNESGVWWRRHDEYGKR